MLSDIVFRDNDNGLTGGTENSEILVQFCEFDSNGTLLASSSAPSHNIYIYGGTFTLLYSYAHDPSRGRTSTSARSTRRSPTTGSLAPRRTKAT